MTPEGRSANRESLASFNLGMRAAHDGYEAAASAASAPAKAILVGEHAVVYGSRAIAMPVPALRLTLRLTPTSRMGAQGEPLIRLFLGGRMVTGHLRGVVDDALTTLDIKPFAFDLEGQSTVLMGAGLGSSAALCVVVLRTLAQSVGLSMTPLDLAHHATLLERRFHGNPSGLDTAVVAHDQAISFRKTSSGGQPSPLRIAAPAAGGEWRFLLLDSGARASTLAMIQGAAPYFQGAGGVSRVEAFDALAADVERGLASGQPETVGAAMNCAAAWLSEAGIVNEALSQLTETALAAGALAAKVTGAGGGGCVLALLDDSDPERALAQIESLKERVGASAVHEVTLAPTPSAILPLGDLS